MRCHTSWPHPWNIPTKQSFFVSNEQVLADYAHFSRLEHQKEHLETNLANCVTYLQALRKKYARGARQLETDSYLPRKKKKKIQQNMRQLEKEIKYRERDEEAFLNNLQACKTNIYLAETMSSSSKSAPSTIPDLASNSTLSPYPDESELTELNWFGLVDTTAHSPIQKSSYSPLVNEMAPDGYLSMDEIAVTTKTGGGPGSGSECVEQTNTTWCSPMTSAPTQFVLRPEAAVFKPRAIYKDQDRPLGMTLDINVNIDTNIIININSTQARR
ncbi:hypothetical protein yc1106_06004 [Curvularia clavata]|uniref:Uncharacterized protein n=1 Tax=Curvularia clavata TaxID=95742 RepID=A0A9Q9DU82_CURCL|nr:hypothetical protein yc1106_06004 [Curvularia clavata]